MKHEIYAEKPQNLIELWPGQYQFFSHFEFLSGVPHALFLITTLKENGTPNANFHSWSGFSGDGGGFFAIMPGLGMHTHTYRNILREKEFCVNFISQKYYQNAIDTINHNEDNDDELRAGGFTPESARTVKAPRIKEAFLSLECILHSAEDLSGAGITSLITGKVIHAAAEAGFYKIDRICGEDGFMFNVHSPKNPADGTGQKTAVCTLKPVKLLDE